MAADAAGAIVFLDIGNRLLQRGEWAAASKAICDFIETVEAAGDEAAPEAKSRLPQAYRNLAFCEVKLGEFDDSVADYKKALGMAQGGKDGPAAAEALRGLGYVTWMRGDPNKALEFQRASLELARSHKMRELIASVLIDMGNSYSNIGNYKSSIISYKKAIEILEGQGVRLELSRAYNNLGFVLMRIEKWDEATEALGMSISHGEASGEMTTVAFARVNMAECQMRQARLDEAAENLEVALEQMESTGDNLGIADVYKRYGQLYAMREEWGIAEQAMRKAMVVVEKSGNVPYVAHIQMALGDMFSRKGSADDARRAYAEAVDIFSGLKMDSEAEQAKTKMAGLK